MKLMKDKKGFTLIELILYICILSIILTIPLLKIGILDNYKERQELKELIRDINYARNHSISKSAIYSVRVDMSRNSYIIEDYSSEPKQFVKEKVLESGLEFLTTNLDSDSITFNKTGRPRNAGTISLTNRKGTTIKVSISPVTGRVSVED